MSYQERRAIVSLLGTILITALYTTYMAQRYPDANAYSPEVFQFWGSFIVILIPVSIFTKIFIYILLAIINAITTGEEEPPITDERDNLIELKSTRNSLYVFAAGFLLAMISVAAAMPPTVMFIILMITGMVSQMVADVSQFIFYRRGV